MHGYEQALSNNAAEDGVTDNKALFVTAQYAGVTVGWA